MIKISQYFAIQSQKGLGILILSFCMGLATAEQTVNVEPENSDVRVLIDVSGSMKKNDPKNLRSPALRLLVGLLHRAALLGRAALLDMALFLQEAAPFQ